MIIAIISVFIIYAYWYSCRSSSLLEKEKLANITIDYMNEENVPDKMKDIVYLSFISAGKWWFFPLVCISSPIALLLANDRDAANSDEIRSKGDKVKLQDVMDSILAVNMKRNPITSIFFGILTLLLSALAILIKVLFGGLKKLPSVSSSVLIVAELVNTLRTKLHA
ncbi:hypothetical protein HB980_00485 [Yersinia massiliensis]|uniref:Uncharacterized protein n=1 Tax=Yersinia massiliensis TaxID=419257 RepID=A0AA90XZZ2_9GAMM|nr:hypothetical protein [Yersinia massiliensis]NIL25039.1 hypothetical protein [Yersinia massiliensis]